MVIDIIADLRGTAFENLMKGRVPRRFMPNL